MQRCTHLPAEREVGPGAGLWTPALDRSSQRLPHTPSHVTLTLPRDPPMQVKTSTPIVDVRWAGQGENEDQVSSKYSCAVLRMVPSAHSCAISTLSIREITPHRCGRSLSSS